MRPVFSPFLPQRTQDPWATGINNLVSGFFSGQATLAEREESEAKKELMGHHAALYRAQGDLMRQKAEEEQLQKKAFEMLPHLVQRHLNPAEPFSDVEQGPGNPARPVPHHEIFSAFLRAFRDPKIASQAFIGMTGGKLPPEAAYALTLAQGAPLNLNQTPTFETQRLRQQELDKLNIQKAQMKANAASARPGHGPTPNQEPRQTEKPLPVHAQKEMERIADKIARLDNLLADFSPEFAGKFPGVGNIQNILGNAGLIDDNYGRQAAFWQAVDTLDQEMRHELYGAAFTKIEKDLWNKTTIHTWMDPKRVRENLDARFKILKDVFARRQAFYQAGGTAGAASQLMPSQGPTPDSLKVRP